MVDAPHETLTLILSINFHSSVGSSYLVSVTNIAPDFSYLAFLEIFLIKPAS